MAPRPDTMRSLHTCHQQRLAKNAITGGYSSLYFQAQTTKILRYVQKPVKFSNSSMFHRRLPLSPPQVERTHTRTVAPIGESGVCAWRGHPIPTRDRNSVHLVRRNETDFMSNFLSRTAVGAVPAFFLLKSQRPSQPF